MAFEDIDQIKITSGGDFDPVPEDVYDVKITNIAKIMGKKWQSEDLEEKVLVEFTIQTGDLAGRKLFTRVRPKLADAPKPSKLFQLSLAALGAAPAKDTKGQFSFSLSSLKEKELRLSVNVNDKGYNDITSYLKAKAPLNPVKEEIMDQDVKPEDLPFK